MKIMNPKKIIFHYLYMVSVNEQLVVALYNKNIYDDFIYPSVLTVNCKMKG